jgi:transcriptional regulator with XRE-family HTH domain
MSTLPQKSVDDIHELRRDAGRWLRGLREAKGLSQRDLAQRTGTEYYTFVSQLETGRGRIPQESYLAWAEALGVEPKVFVRTLMQYYDPVTHDILFPERAKLTGSEIYHTEWKLGPH